MTKLKWDRPNGGYHLEPWQKTHPKVAAPKPKRLGDHRHHPAVVIGPKGPHAGGLYCTQCSKLICWLTPAEYKIAKERK